jgi:prepilin-type N-terminal cleavage/methylation domain-containing protein
MRGCLKPGTKSQWKPAFAAPPKRLIQPPKHARLRAFTLIELMIVIGIMGIVLSMGVPLVYKVTRKDPMTKAITGIFEACSHARARAILNGQDTSVVFHPKDGRFDVSSAGSASPDAAASGTVTTSAGSGLSGQISDQLSIEMFEVNLNTYLMADDAKVVFHPNGTSDELVIVLRYGPEWRKITLEAVTGLADVSNVR